MSKTKNPFTLLDLSDEITNISQDIIDAEIAGDMDQVEALMEELDSLYDKRSDKHEAYVFVIKNALAAAPPCRVEAEAFTVRARALENTAKRLKRRLLDDLQKHGEAVANAGIFKIARQKNSQPTLKLTIDAEDLPQDFQRITIEADKDAIKEALNAGEEIDGAALEDGEHIRIPCPVKTDLRKPIGQGTNALP